MTDEGPVPGTPHVERLHRPAGELLRTGSLPRNNPTRTYGGQGSGDICALCGALIRDSEVEFEAVFVLLDSSSTMTRSYHFHRTCHQVWDRERHCPGR
jgi:hypothetical protein